MSFFVVLLLSLAGFAQDNGSSQAPNEPAPAPAQDEIASTIHRTVSEVNVVFTVTDKHGHYVKDLQKQDIQVVDDRRPRLKFAASAGKPTCRWKLGYLSMPAIRSATASNLSNSRPSSSLIRLFVRAMTRLLSLVLIPRRK